MIRSTAISATVLAAVLLAGCGGSGSNTSTDSTTSSADSGAAQIVSANSLRETASEMRAPIYWAGKRAGTGLELSQPDENRTYVRYLTGGAEAGDKRADFLTVGTYRQPNAVANLHRQAKRSGGTIAQAPGNATAYYDRENSQSVYLAYPGAPVEVEVFDPSFKRALRLVESGQIVAVE